MADSDNSSLLNALQSSINSVQTSVKELDNQTKKLDSKVDLVKTAIEKVSTDLQTLTQDFQKMVEDQKKAVSLQKAISELIRVRQEIEQKYGNYSTIRETMLGVLQATDAALVKKTTISQVSEELMLSTPKYWLAPCLVAVSAWISNDRSLAERAIAEALKRNEEKTALAMALICRRSGRIETGYEWLSLYFAKQSAASITEETFTYIDAYVNGVFGPDEKHMCQGYVSKWIDEVRGNKSNFESSQEEKWKAYCDAYRQNVGEQFPELLASVAEFPKINSCVGAIISYGAIRDKFKAITDAYIDQEQLKKSVDAELVRLVSNYDASEVVIRTEEEYLSLVKFYEGDEGKARAEMDVRELKRTQHKLDFIEQMSHEITVEEATAPSKRRTAVAFLSSYINRGFNKYISESKSQFPAGVTISVDKWSGKSVDGSEGERLTSDFEKQMDEERKREIHYVDKTKPKLFMALSIIMFVLAVVLFFISPLCAAGGVIAGIIFLLARLRVLANNTKAVARINDKYSDRITAGKAKLTTVMQQWQAAHTIVNDYDNNGIHEIVA